MPGGYGAKWWRVSFARASRYRRIDVALSGAPVMANASGKNASRPCRAGVRNRDRDDFLRTSSSHGARNARRWLEFETESNVSRKGSIGRTGLCELCESFANFAVKSLQPQNAPRQRKGRGGKERETYLHPFIRQPDGTFIDIASQLPGYPTTPHGCGGCAPFSY